MLLPDFVKLAEAQPTKVADPTSHSNCSPYRTRTGLPAPLTVGGGRLQRPRARSSLRAPTVSSWTFAWGLTKQGFLFSCIPGMLLDLRFLLELLALVLDQG